MSQLRQSRSVATREGAREDPDALMQTLDAIGVLAKPAAGRRASSRARPATSFWAGRRKPPEPAAPTPVTPSVQEIIAGESGPEAIRRLLDVFKATFPNELEIEHSQDGAFHRLLFKELNIPPGDARLKMLDFSGIHANLELRFENCRFDVIDLSYASLHSVRFRSCEAHPDSPLAPYGMRILADGLTLTGDFYVEGLARPSRILTLQAYAMKACEVQLLDSEFNGGKLAERIWKDAPREKHPDHPVYKNAAYSVLKTVDLAALRADAVILSARCIGMVDLHDARIDRKLIVVAGEHASYRQALLGRKGLVGEQGLQLIPCLHFGGVTCHGEIRLEGLEPETYPKGNDPPVFGHVQLTNAKCRVFAYDAIWLDLCKDRPPRLFSPRPPLTFDLNNFTYDFLGRSSRYLFDEDRQSKQWRLPLFGGGGDPGQQTIDWEVSRQDAYGDRYQASTQITAHVEETFVDKLVDLLKAVEDKTPFNSQPMTHCATVLRQSGSLTQAEIILFEREKNTRWPRGRCWSIFFGLAFGGALFWILLRLIWLFDKMEGGPIAGKWDEIPATSSIPIVVGLIVALSARFAEGSLKKLFARFVPAILFVCLVTLVLHSFDHSMLQAILSKKHTELGALFVGGLLIVIVGLPTSLSRGLSYAVLWATVGFGYKPGWAIIQSLVFVAVGALVFDVAYEKHLLMRNPVVTETGLGGARPGAGASPKEHKQEPTPSRPAASLGTFKLASARDYRDPCDLDPAACEKETITDAPPALPSPSPGTDKQSRTEPPPRQAVDDDETAKQTARESERSGPSTAEGTATDSCEAKQGSSDDEYPRFNGLMYGIDVFIPVIDFSQGAYWVPGPLCKTVETKERNKDVASAWNTRDRGLIVTKEQADGIKGGTESKDVASAWNTRDAWLIVVWIFYWVLIAAGWLYTTVLIATFAGFIERKE